MSTSTVVPSTYTDAEGTTCVFVPELEGTDGAWRPFDQAQDGILRRYWAGLQSLEGRADLQVSRLGDTVRVETGTDGYHDYDLRVPVVIGCTGNDAPDDQPPTLVACNCPHGNHRVAQMQATFCLHISNGGGISPHLRDVQVLVRSNSGDEATSFVVPDEVAVKATERIAQQVAVVFAYELIRYL